MTRILKMQFCALIVLSAVAVAFAVNGVAVVTHWNGINANLWGNYGQIEKYTVTNNVSSKTATLYSGTARWPTIDHTGSKVAFIKQLGEIAVVSIDGGTATDLCSVPSGGNDEGFLGWPTGDWIYYTGGGYSNTKSSELWRVNANTKQNERVVTFVTNGTTPVGQWSWGISSNGQRMFIRCNDSDGNFNKTAYGDCFFVQLPTSFPQNIELGKTELTGVHSVSIDGCGAAISPDGSICIAFPGSHSEIAFRHWWQTSPYQTIAVSAMFAWGNIENTGTEGNWLRFAVNSDKWICAMTGKDRGKNGSSSSRFNFVDQEAISIAKSSGYNDCYDPGSFFIGEATSAPVLSLTPTSLDFDAVIGLTAPAAQTVTVKNTGSETMDNVTTAINYAQGSDWLSVTRGGANNAQTLSNTVNIAGLSEGDYSATVTVTASNASPSTAAYTVSLSVTQPPVYTTLKVTPTSATTQPGGRVSFLAEALDQFDNSFSQQPTSIQWSASGGGTIATTGLFTAGTTEGGPFTVTATAQIGGVTKSGTAQVSVKSVSFADNMVGYWSFDDITGTTVPDGFGNNDGTLSNATATTGKIAQALTFTSASSRVTLPNMDISAGGSGTDGITIAAWVKGTAFSDGRIVSKATGTVENDSYWTLSSAGHTIWFRLKTDGATTTLISSSDVLASETWAHVAATYDGSTMRLYKDGVEVGSAAKTGTISTNESVGVAIGNNPAGAGDKPFGGDMDEVYLFNRALSGAELTSLMSGAGEEPVGPIKILKPDGSLAYQVGQVLTIQWEIDFAQVANGVMIEFSTDEDLEAWARVSGGSAIVEGSEYYSGNVGTYSFTIPEQAGLDNGSTVSTVSNKCVIKVSGPYEPDIPVSISRPFPITNESATRFALVHGLNGPAMSLTQTASDAIVFSVNTKSEYCLEMFSIKGRRVFTQSGSRPATYRVARHSLMAGTYIVRLRNENKVFTRQLVLQ